MLCENSTPMALRGLALVELQQTAEALTTRDRAGSDHGCRGRDQFVAQTLVGTFFMIMINKRANGGCASRIANSRAESPIAQRCATPDV